MEPVTLSQICEVTGGTGLDGNRSRVQIRRVCTDSREIQPGDLYWALRGERHDGNDFTEQSFQKGAIAAVIDRADQANGGNRICVRDTGVAIKQLAHWYRRERESLIIGVTGSVGKTTTRDLIHHVLKTNFIGIRSARNYNNEVGVPLSLLSIESRHEYAVIELAARKIGEIAELAELASPEIGVVTAVAPVHLETFGSLDQIEKTKGELIEALPKQALAILAGDDVRVRNMKHRARCRVVTVGEGIENSIRATEVEVSEQGLEFKVQNKPFLLRNSGRHLLTGGLLAIAVGLETGVPIKLIAEGLQEFEPLAGRGQVHSLGPITLIDESYNASPWSMRAACNLLMEYPARGRRILIAGDMLELGNRADEYHRELGLEVGRSKIDRLIAFGAQAERVVEAASGMGSWNLASCKNWDSLLTVIGCWVSEGDVILIKGSRSIGLDRLLPVLKERSLEIAGQIHGKICA